MIQPVFRFAPSPNGRLHLGHAYSALLNAEMARVMGGRFLVRIEDIDPQRCTEANTDNALADLHWLGLEFEKPVLRQSRRSPAYWDAIVRLMEMDLLYVCTCTRQQVANRASAHGAFTLDPEAQPVYPGTCSRLALPFYRTSALRLRMAQAVRLAEDRAGPLTWREKGEPIAADPLAWGDVIIARKEIGTSYHLSVVIDDAHQNVTHVVRGHDLFHATAIHRVLQVLLGLPQPDYHHHQVLRDETGHKLSKSKADESLADVRGRGISASEIRRQLGFA